MAHIPRQVVHLLPRRDVACSADDADAPRLHVADESGALRLSPARARQGDDVAGTVVRQPRHDGLSDTAEPAHDCVRRVRPELRLGRGRRDGLRDDKG